MASLAGLWGDKPMEQWAQEAGEAYDLFNPGWHEVFVETAELKPNSAGTGYIVKVEFQNKQGQRCMNVYNVKHPNETAERIGKAQLAKLAWCCGIENLTDTDELVGRNVQIRTEIEEYEFEDQERKRTKITGYKPVEEGQEQAPIQQDKQQEVPW